MEGVQVIKYPYPKLGEESFKSIITVKNINLSFYDKLSYNGTKMKDFLWKLFTIDKIDDLHDIEENIKELSYYCKELERLSKSEEFCMLVWDEKLEKKLQNLAAYGDGKEAGTVETRNEMIRKLYKNNVSVKIICNSTGLTKEEIGKIINNIKE